jgi:epoxyqueuosine reductase
MDLTTRLKDLALREGASLVGVAPVERFAGAPRGHGPRDFIPTARSVVSIALKLPDGIVDREGYLAEAEYPPEVRHRVLETHIYNKQGYALPNLLLDQVAYRLALLLESEGYRTLPVPATMASYTMPDMSPKEVGYFGIFSHRHAAVRAGLGEFGYNNIVLTPRFGPRIRFTSLITTAPLQADPLLTEPVCLREGCRKCLDACPVRALSLRPERSSGIFLDPPARTAAEVCSGRPPETSQGTCLRVCPVGSGLSS